MSEQRSRLDIYNRALSLCKGNQISDPDGESLGAQECNLHWPSVRRAMLRSGAFTCARSQQVLVKDIAGPDFRFDNKFRKPADCLLIDKVNIQFDTRYKIYGDYIYTNADEVDLDYIKDEQDPVAYDSLLYDLAHVALAKRIVLSLTEDEQRISTVAALYRELKVESYMVDSGEETPDLTGDESDWLGERMYGSCGEYKVCRTQAS